MVRVPVDGFSVWARRGRTSLALFRGLASLDAAARRAREAADYRSNGAEGLSIRSDSTGTIWLLDRDANVLEPIEADTKREQTVALDLLRRSEDTALDGEP
jgi:hypothetical protein